MTASTESLAEARLAGADLPAVRLVDSDDLGWRHALVRTYRDDRTAPAFRTRPTEDLLLVVVRSGSGVLQVRRGGAWATGRYHPGSVGVTAPGTSSTLRWHTTSTEPMVSTHVHLAGALVADTAAALAPPRACLTCSSSATPSSRKHSSLSLGAQRPRSRACTPRASPRR